MSILTTAQQSYRESAWKSVIYVENTGRFKERYLRAGGSSSREIVKLHIGHHPHSMTTPKPLVEFVEHC